MKALKWYLILCLNEFVNSLGEATIFSTLDWIAYISKCKLLKSVKTRRSSRFITVFCVVYIFFGFQNDWKTFELAINVFQNYLPLYFLVRGQCSILKTPERDMDHGRQVLTLPQDIVVTLSLHKWKFSQTTLIPTAISLALGALQCQTHDSNHMPTLTSHYHSEALVFWVCSKFFTVLRNMWPMLLLPE